LQDPETVLLAKAVMQLVSVALLVLSEISGASPEQLLKPAQISGEATT
jgi:hypothetical protein